MKLYAVRMIGSRECVGVYWVKNLDELVFAVDGVVDPSVCEYVVISGSGALVWLGKAYAMGVDRSNAFDELTPRAKANQKAIEHFLDGAELDGVLNDLLSVEIGGWKRVLPE